MIQDELNRFDRSLAILILLQSRKRVTAAFLAERFSVSLRTVYRDIRSLEAAGVPIMGEAGMGYTLMEGYRLPPVMFTREEAASFIAAEKLMQQFTDVALGASFVSAVNKLKSVLRGSEKDWIAALEGKIWARPITEARKELPNVLETLFGSIAEQLQVSMEYHAMTASEPTLRQIEPVGVFHEQAHWYLYAYCHLRKDYRQFRTDRIKAISITQVPFSQTHSDFRRPVPGTYSGPREKVVLTVKKELARFLNSEKKYYGIVSEEVCGDEMRMEFQCPMPLEGMARWFLMFGDHARILEPEILRQKVRELAAKNIERLAP
ncbi:MAG: YafY family transcriptional regulator [Bacteroidetes bacterium]|nr:YafY family transcriptional regulator [Bacteroidota bacterium]MBS1629040.1 YafY family transcriptional regulator [Bacteroidota bacterium]